MAKRLYWYKKANRKHATGFLLPADHIKLKRLAKAADMSLARYISRIIEKHIREHNS